MARRKFTKKRLELLLDLEQIIGNECYNPNIQNWGPGGSYEGEGRRIRYPLTVEDENGIKRKRRVSMTDLEPNQLMQGYYAFGSNQLHIMKALGAVIDQLEAQAGVKFAQLAIGGITRDPLWLSWPVCGS